MISKNHIIAKETVELKASSLVLANEWEMRINQMLRDVINPTIERCFDNISNHVGQRILEKVEIDLGLINKLSDREIIDKIEDEFSKFVSKNSLSIRSEVPDTVESPVSDRVSMDEISIASAFCYFLTYGRLPYWFSAEPDFFQGYWIEQLTLQQSRRIQETVKRNLKSIDRIIYQFDIDFIIKLLRQFNAGHTDGILTSWNWFKQLARVHGNEPPSLFRIYWSFGISTSLNISYDDRDLVKSLLSWIHSAPTLREILRNRLSTVESETVSWSSLIPEFVPNNQIAFKLLKGLFEKALKGVDESESECGNESGSKSIGNKRNYTHGDRFSNDNLGDTDTSHLPIDNWIQGEKSINRKDSKTPSDDKEENEFYTEASGLVILHPFLVELFRIGNLWVDGKWTSDFARSHGVRLLGWLAYGKEDVPEFQLSIPKMLCGMSSIEPVDTKVHLSDFHRQSGFELLEAVIAHWKALRKTSVDGLREGFILREGKVTYNEEGYRVTVERKAQDILLSKLPWGLSMIYLPWMEKKKIFVEWI